MALQGHLWGKLPRPVYWVLGAAISFAGAIAARLIAAQVPDYRVPIWLAGAIVIFLGVSILSLGTKARLQLEIRDGDGEPNDGAGEGNRTLA